MAKRLSNGGDGIEAARRSLLGYACWMDEKYRIPKHIREIADVLEAVERGEIKRVIITTPPRHGKSLLCSQRFPAWYMGRNPDKYIISATYGQGLADDFGGQVRNQLIDPMFRVVFPDCVMNQDSKAKGHFETSSGGTYFGVGRGAAIVGRGAHLGLIDDPIKNREEADSKLQRDNLIKWYQSVFYTRLMPGAAVFVIQTRWHEGDLVGWLLRETAHEDWTVINMPVRDDSGEPLWPDQYASKDLDRIKATMSDYEWSCLYMQDPLPEEGIIFKADWIHRGVDEEYAAIFAAIDPAISMKTQADESSITVIGVRKGVPARVDEIETLSGHWGFREQVENCESVITKYSDPDNYGGKFVLFGVEDTYYQRALGEELQMRGRAVSMLKASKDKVQRAMWVTDWFSQGRIRLNTPKLIKQTLSFRGGDEKNDCADSMIHAITMAKDYYREGAPIEEDRYAHLDARSKQFWMDHFKEKERREEPSSMQLLGI